MSEPNDNMDYLSGLSHNNPKTTYLFNRTLFLLDDTKCVEAVVLYNETHTLSEQKNSIVSVSDVAASDSRELFISDLSYEETKKITENNSIDDTIPLNEEQYMHLLDNYKTNLFEVTMELIKKTE